MIKHTPGPWTYPGTGNVIGGPDRQRVADVYRDNLSADERQANARLIAEAPAMVKALRAVTEQLAAFADTADEWRTDPGNWIRDGINTRICCATPEVDKARAILARLT
jgi:hypothetical protein